MQEHVWSFIEWPEIIESFLQESQLKTKVCKIELAHCIDDQNQREFNAFF
jgi:tRNA A37 threonylcarbamoyladenosine biosynthesis protein TsaE